MSSQADYSPEEWETIVNAPVMAGTLVIISDPAVFGSIKESAAMVKKINEAATTTSTEIIRAVGEAIRAGHKFDKSQMPKEDSVQATMNILVKKCHQAALIVKEKSPEEEEPFNQYLVEIAKTTAASSKEGGFLGIGAVRVSDAERAAVDQLAEALGVTKAE